MIGDVADEPTQAMLLSVIDVLATRLAIVQPPAMPVPSTGMPTPSRDVSVIPVIVALLAVRVPFCVCFILAV